MVPLRNGKMAISCSRCRSLRQRCRTDGQILRWELINGQYSGVAEREGRSGRRRRRIYYEKAPLTSMPKSSGGRGAHAEGILASRAEIVTNNDASPPSSSQIRITVETSAIPNPAQPNTPRTARRQTHYPLTPPLEAGPSAFRITPLSPGASGSGARHHTRSSNSISSNMAVLQHSFAKAERKASILMQKELFASSTVPDGIDSELLKLDIEDSFGDALNRLEDVSHKFERAIISALSKPGSNGPAEPSSQASSQRSSTSPGVLDPEGVLKAMKALLDNLQRKTQLSSSYQQLVQASASGGQAGVIDLCRDVIEDVREVNRGFRRLCVELKESVTVPLRAV